jgi:hypothetical protein
VFFGVVMRPFEVVQKIPAGARNDPQGLPGVSAIIEKIR